MGRRRVRISNQLAADVLSSNWTPGDDRAIRCMGGLPDGAVLVDAYMTNSIHVGMPPDLELQFEHAMWGENVPEDEIPMLTPTYQTMKIEATQEEC